ncbi:MAG: type II toxin-antitoxin system YafQ family toxin, partial [Verrucomicrobia bacterium]|nr:type II toxin-antitoxin system YafQ family toxin [Verrucomicrobiota bacterium]
FRKDVKRAKKRGKDLSKLKKVIDLLIESTPLPPSYKDHPLHGEFVGSRDLHIESDWILIYTASPDHLRLERTGTHSDFFR